MIKQLFSLLLSILIFPAIAFAQKEAAVYFRNNRVTPDSTVADYYRIVESRSGDMFNYREYHKDGTWIAASGKVSIADPVKVGDEKYFYKSGQVAIVNHYENGRHTKTTGYYPNGILMQILMMRNGFPDVLVSYDADSSGRAHIKNGDGVREETDTIRSFNIKERYTMTGPYKGGLKNGLWKGSDDSGFMFEEKYEAGKLISGSTETPEGKKFRYTRLYEYPQFNGDINQFEKHIIPDLKNIADTTGLKFFKSRLLRLTYIINADGKVESVQGFKRGEHVPVDLELKTVLPKIQPAKLRGVPIAYKVIDNADSYVRNNFTITFNVDPRLKGQLKPVHVPL